MDAPCARVLQAAYLTASLAACAQGFKTQQRRALEPPEHVIRDGRVRELLGILVVAQMRDPRPSPPHRAGPPACTTVARDAAKVSHQAPAEVAKTKRTQETRHDLSRAIVSLDSASWRPGRSMCDVRWIDFQHSPWPPFASLMYP